MPNPVLVVAELRQGKIKKASLEAIGAGRKLAAERGGRLAALLVGEGAAAEAAEAAAYGADDVLTVEGEAFSGYAPEAWRDATLAAVKAVEPELVLFPATSMGLDFAPRVAARLGVSLLSDCVTLGWAEGGIEARRPVFAGKAYATARLAARPALASLRPNVFTAPEPEPGRAHEARALDVSSATPRARAVSIEASKGGKLDVAEADIIVSGGRGLKGPENFVLVEQLAQALGGAVGASRAVVDAGWIDHAHQVGQTGKTVSPALYIACGISGAIQHLAGMSSSNVIVAINKDPDAPIFKVATYGIVGDLFEVLPALTEEIKKYRAGHA